MTKSATIFIQIPAYREHECAPTLADMFDKAAEPERLYVGLCWQYKPGEDEAMPALPERYAKQIRVSSFPTNESKGVSWARYEAQKHYQNEDYTLMIDSHMRFAKNWDTTLIAQLRKCSSNKAIIATHPPDYIPPDQIRTDAKLVVIRAHSPSVQGEIRFRGETLDSTPPAPLRGAFAPPACLFAAGGLVHEVPSDPYLYFEQEEVCYSARLYTHGWDVFHPTEHAVFHLYDNTAVAFQRHKHWEDNPNWAALNAIAVERRSHLLGHTLAKSDASLAELDLFGHGQARSLEQYADFCGIDFANGIVTNRALNCEFIENLKRYRNKPFSISNALQAPKSERILKEPSQKFKPVASPHINVPISQFKPKNLDILSSPIYQPPHLPKRNRPAAKIITEGVPDGVLLVENYASPELCQYLMDYSERTLGTKLQVVDSTRSVGDTVVFVDSDNRRTESVSINEISGEMLNIFMDIYTQRLAPFYGVDFEWFERPQILRYRAGGRYDPHADADDLNPETNIWMRVQDRDISVLLYLNEDYEGGKLSFERLGFSIQPKAGMLIAFPSDHRYVHAARPTTAGIRYVIVSWSTHLNSMRVRLLPPYASVCLHIPNG